MDHGKLFIDKNESNNKIVKVPYDQSQKFDYYSFVRKCHEEGLQQVIITSKIMIELAKYYFLDRKFRISSIEFIEEDKELQTEISSILNMLEKDRAYFELLISKLEFIACHSSIDIKKICFKGSSVSNNVINLMFQVNGIYGVSNTNFEEESNNVIKKIKRYFIQ